MRYHAQNLNESKGQITGSMLSHGRAWFYLGKRKYDETFHVEWLFGKRANNLAFKMSFGYGDSESGICFHVCVPYTYTLKNGTVQNRKASVHIERRTYRRKWHWLLRKRMVNTSISVDFDDEVGEETGSWKGGTVGCGYNLLPGETALECLRRMEKERIF